MNPYFGQEHEKNLMRAVGTGELYLTIIFDALDDTYTLPSVDRFRLRLEQHIVLFHTMSEQTIPLQRFIQFSAYTKVR